MHSPDNKDKRAIQMRIIISCLIWVVFAGLISLFTFDRPPDPASFKTDVETVKSVGSSRIELTTTFNPEADPFSLSAGSSDADAALVLMVNNREVIRLKHQVMAGETIRLENISEFKHGLNQIYLEAVPPISSMGKSQAARIRISIDGRKVADETFWSEFGERIIDSFILRITPLKKEYSVNE